MRSWSCPGLLLAAAIAGSGCERWQDDAEVRSARATHGDAPLRLGLVWPATVSAAFDPGLGFWEGAELALERAGPTLPRPLLLQREIEDGTLATAKLIAERLAADPQVVAVVGHRDAEAARVTSVIYEYGGVLMMATGSAGRGLSRPGFERVFRLMPTDEELAAQLADHALAHQLSPVLIVYANDAHGRAVANAFESRAEAIGVKIADRLGFESGAPRSLDPGLEEARTSGPRAVLLAERMPAAAAVLERVRAAGLGVPVLGTDDLDTGTLPGLPGADDTVVATPALDPAVAVAFQEKYGRAPDTWAAQGYLGVALVTEAMVRAHSADPARVAETLRADGGRIRFGARGEPLGRRLTVKRVVEKRFRAE